MPNGSSGPGPPLPPPPTSTISHDDLITTFSTTTTTTTIDHLPSPSPPRKFLLSGPKPKRTVSVENVNMKAKIFGGGNPPSSPTTQRPRTGHQTIRGRISGPIPMPNPLDDDEFPMRNPGTGIASSTPIDNDLAVQRQLQSSISKPASPVTPGFAPGVAQTFPPLTGGGRVDMIDVPQTVLEHPSTPTQQIQHPPSSGTTTTGGGGGGPSPEGGASSVSATHSSTTKAAHRANNPSGSARYSGVSANSQKTGNSNSNAPADGPPQRKKSTLRSAIGKFLRRGKKKEGSLSSVSEIDRQVALGGQQHRSVSSGLLDEPPFANILCKGWSARLTNCGCKQNRYHQSREMFRHRNSPRA